MIIPLRPTATLPVIHRPQICFGNAEKDPLAEMEEPFFPVGGKLQPPAKRLGWVTRLWRSSIGSKPDPMHQDLQLLKLFNSMINQLQPSSVKLIRHDPVSAASWFVLKDKTYRLQWKSVTHWGPMVEEGYYRSKKRTYVLENTYTLSTQDGQVQLRWTKLKDDNYLQNPPHHKHYWHYQLKKWDKGVIYENRRNGQFIQSHTTQVLSKADILMSKLSQEISTQYQTLMSDKANLDDVPNLDF